MQKTGSIKRRAYRQSKANVAGRNGWSCVASSPSKFGGRGGVDRSDGVVELPDACKSRSEGRFGERHIGRLNQHPGCLGALCSCQRQRSGSDLFGEHPGELSVAVVEVGGQSTDAVSVNDAVGNQSHRSPDEVGTSVPLRGARGGIWSASFAGPKPCELGCGCRAMEANVGPLWGDGWAAGPTVDAGGGHCCEEPAVESGILPQHSPVTSVIIHGPSLAAPTCRS